MKSGKRETCFICILHLGKNGLNHSSVLMQFISLLLFFLGDLSKKPPQTNKLPKPHPSYQHESWTYLSQHHPPPTLIAMSMLENLICEVLVGTLFLVLNCETGPSRILAWAWFGRKLDQGFVHTGMLWRRGN